MVKNLPPIQETQETQVQCLDGEISPGEGNSNPLQYSCLDNSMDRGAWWATVHEGSPWGLKESDMTEQLHMHILTNKKVISIKKKKTTRRTKHSENIPKSIM